MAHPYRDEAALATLTDTSASEIRTLLDQADGNRVRIVGLREAQERKIEEAKAEIRSLDRILDLLDSNADMFRATLGQPPRILKLQAVEEPTAEHHEATWNGAEAPETGMFAAVPDLSSDPDGNIERLNELHDAQNEREGGKE